MSDDLVDARPRPIGKDIQVGPLAFGCWRFVHEDLLTARGLIEAARDEGMNLIDTADVYGTDWGGAGFGAAEELLGKVFAEAPQLRDQTVLATKGGICPGTPYDSSPDALASACEASLRRLQVDAIDLYQVHRPDLFSHPEDLADTLFGLRDSGKIREFGISNYSPDQYDALRAYLGDSLVTMQCEYSAVHLDRLHDGTLDRALRDGVTPLAWSPLGGGRIFTGDRMRPELLAVLDEIAARENTERAVVAIAFVLAHPARPIAIVGTQQAERLALAATAPHLTLDRQDCYRIIQASEGIVFP